jgi:hypothetical protein
LEDIVEVSLAVVFCGDDGSVNLGLEVVLFDMAIYWDILKQWSLYLHALP